MTDVLKIALDRRAELHDEVEKLDQFIRMAETLIRKSQDTAPIPMESMAPRDSSAEASMRQTGRRGSDQAAESTDVPRPSIIRRGAAAG